MPILRRTIVFPYSDAPPGPGQFLPALAWEVPRFDGQCICCSSPAAGGTAILLADRAKHRTSLEVPMCSECAGHAFSTRPGQALAVAAVFIAAGFSALAIFDPGMLGFAAAPGALILAAAVVAVLASAWIAIDVMQSRAPTDGKHHPDPVLDLGAKGVMLRTTNEQFADAVLRLNPTAVDGAVFRTGDQAGNQPPN